MDDQQNPKYVTHHAVQSAVGDHANVNNYFPAPQAQADPGVAELRSLFVKVNERLAALEAADRELVVPAVEQAEQATSDIQQGDDSPAKQGFLETRLKHIYAMAPDIGEVIITTLASPAVGIALATQKIAQKARAELGLDQPAEQAETPKP